MHEKADASDQQTCGKCTSTGRNEQLAAGTECDHDERRKSIWLGEQCCADSAAFEIEVGTKLAPVVLQYSQDVIDRYALASLDMNPVHTNTDWSARAQVFGVPETVGHGMMSMSSMASVVTRAWGSVSQNGGRVRFADAKFTKPVRNCQPP